MLCSFVLKNLILCIYLRLILLDLYSFLLFCFNLTILSFVFFFRYIPFCCNFFSEFIYSMLLLIVFLYCSLYFIYLFFFLVKFSILFFVSSIAMNIRFFLSSINCLQ